MSISSRLGCLLAALALSGCGASPHPNGLDAEEARTAPLELREIAFDVERLEARADEVIELELRNAGTLEHDFRIEDILWVTLVLANKVVAITPGGDVLTIIDDPTGELMRAPTNVAWGGSDMRDLYIGSLFSDHILHARSPVPGLPLFHQRGA